MGGKASAMSVTMACSSPRGPFPWVTFVGQLFHASEALREASEAPERVGEVSEENLGVHHRHEGEEIAARRVGVAKGGRRPEALLVARGGPEAKANLIWTDEDGQTWTISIVVEDAWLEVLHRPGNSGLWDPRVQETDNSQ